MLSNQEQKNESSNSNKVESLFDMACDIRPLDPEKRVYPKDEWTRMSQSERDLFRDNNSYENFD